MSEANPLSPEAQERRRKIYVRHRFFVLRDEMDRAVEETQQLIDKLSGGALPSDLTERKKLQERLIYLREYWPQLKAEFQAVRAEHKGVADQSSAGPPGGSPPAGGEKAFTSATRKRASSGKNKPSSPKKKRTD